MEGKRNARNLVKQALLKLNSMPGERRNVLAFIQSCYCGRVRRYRLEDALAALSKLSAPEEHALIAWAVLRDEAAGAAEERRDTGPERGRPWTLPGKDDRKTTCD